MKTELLSSYYKSNNEYQTSVDYHREIRQKKILKRMAKDVPKLRNKKKMGEENKREKEKN